MSYSPLPAEFVGLERFTEKWVLPSNAARHHARLNSSLEELNEFYHALLPRLEEIIAYLDHYELGKMPEKETNLMSLAFSFMEIALPVERFKRPGIRNFDATRLTVMM